MRYVSILSRSGLVLWMPIAASCDQADEPNEDRAATSSASPSPTESLVPAVCDYAEELREVLKDVDEGTELPEDLVMSLGESRAVLAEQAEIDFNPATAEALEDPGQRWVGSRSRSLMPVPTTERISRSAPTC